MRIVSCVIDSNILFLDEYRQHAGVRGHGPISVPELFVVRHHDIVHERNVRLVYFHCRRHKIQVKS